MLAVEQLALIVSPAPKVTPKVKAKLFCVLTDILLAICWLAVHEALATCTDKDTFVEVAPKLAQVMVLMIAFVLDGTVYTVVSVLALGFC